MIEKALAKNRWRLPLLLLIGCLLFYSNVWPFNRTGGVLFGLDLREYTYPYFDFISREIKQTHELPLWNPHQLSGFSIIGSGEVNIFYPPNWLAFVWDVRKVSALNVIVHSFISMWGVAALARRLGASHLGALFAGLLWGGSGFMGARVWAGHYMILLPMAWMPWVYVSYLTAIARQRWRASLPGAAALGLMVLSGHPQITFLTLVTLFVIWTFTILKTPTRLHFWHATRPFLIIVVVGLLVSAIAILPVIETALASKRNSDTLDRLTFADRFSLPANQLFTFVFPYLMGTEDHIPGDPNFDELFAYIGLLPLIGLIVLLRKPTAELWLLIVMAALGVVLSLGLDGGMLRLLIQIIPPLGMFRSAGRWLSLTQMALACGAGLFITWLQTTQPEARQLALQEMSRQWLPILTLLCFGFALALSFGRVVLANALYAHQLWNSAQLIAKTGLALLLLNLTLIAIQRNTQAESLALVVLIAIGVLEVWAATLPLVRVGPWDTYKPFWHELERVLPAAALGTDRLMIDEKRYRALNGATGRGYYDVSGYEQLSADAYEKWIGDQEPLALANRLLGVAYFVRGQPLTDEVVTAAGLDLFWADPAQKLYIYKFRDPVPRAFLATRINVNHDDRAVREFYAQSGDASANFVTLDKPAACLKGSYNLAGGTAAIVEYRPNRVRIAVSADGPGLLFLSDRYDTGWQASINGRKAPVYRANTAFRAVCLPDGKSEVVFVYRPGSLLAGGIISLAGWVVLGMIAISGAFKHFRAPVQSA